MPSHISSSSSSSLLHLQIHNNPFSSHDPIQYKPIFLHHQSNITRSYSMELFTNPKTLRLRSCHHKFLLAHPDGISVFQDRNGNSSNAFWTVEHVPDKNAIRFKSCFHKYLTASDDIYLLGVAGRKVTQTSPAQIEDYSLTEWEPVKDGVFVKLRTGAGHFLRANGGLPPIRNSVTHNTPRRCATQEWILWDVEAADKKQQWLRHEFQTLQSIMSWPKDEDASALQDGRLIYFTVMRDDGNVAEMPTKKPCFRFIGSEVGQLKQRLAKETSLRDFIVCSSNPFDGKLYALKLYLPQNNETMHVVVVPSVSKAAKDIQLSP